MAKAVHPPELADTLAELRMALRKRRYREAAQSALDALQRIHQLPMAHFLLGVSLAGLKEYERAASALAAAISYNPNFPEAHLRLARLLEARLGDAVAAREHRRLARAMRRHKAAPLPAVSAAERVERARRGRMNRGLPGRCPPGCRLSTNA